jgi:hypothetical protein
MDNGRLRLADLLLSINDGRSIYSGDLPIAMHRLPSLDPDILLVSLVSTGTL